MTCMQLFLSGDDAYGRKVIVLSACRLPAREVIDHEKLLMLVCANTLSVIACLTITRFQLLFDQPTFPWLLLVSLLDFFLWQSICFISMLANVILLLERANVTLP